MREGLGHLGALRQRGVQQEDARGAGTQRRPRRFAAEGLHHRADLIARENGDHPSRDSVQCLHAGDRDRGLGQIDQLQLVHEVSPAIRGHHRMRRGERRGDQSGAHLMGSGGCGLVPGGMRARGGPPCGGRDD